MNLNTKLEIISVCVSVLFEPFQHHDNTDNHDNFGHCNHDVNFHTFSSLITNHGHLRGLHVDEGKANDYRVGRDELILPSILCLFYIESNSLLYSD